MHKQMIRIASLLVVITLAPGCIKSPLKKKIVFTPLSEQQATSYKQTINGVTLRAHELSDKECKNLLGTKKPFATSVMQIDVTNNQTAPWILNKKIVNDIYILPDNIVADRFQPRTKQALIRMAGSFLIAPAFILVPLVAIGVGIVNVKTSLPFYTDRWFLTSLGFLGATIACTTFTNICMNNNKKKLDIQLRKAIQRISPETLVVQPGTTQSMLLFVDGKHLPPSFDIPIHEADNPTNTRTFSVQI